MPIHPPLIAANPFGYALSHPCFLWLFCLLGFFLGLSCAYYIWNRSFHLPEEAANAENLRLREGLLIARRAAPALQKNRLIEEKLQVVRGESKVLKVHVRQLSHELETASTKLTGVETKLVGEREQTRHLKSEVRSLKGRFEETQLESATFKNRVARLNAAVQEEQAISKGREGELVQLKAATKETIANMDHELTALQSDVNQRDQTISKANDRVRELEVLCANHEQALKDSTSKMAVSEKELAKIRTEIASYKSKQEDMAAQLNERGALKDQLRKLRSEHESADQRWKTLRGQHEQLEKELAVLRESYEERDRAAKSCSEERERLERELETCRAASAPAASTIPQGFAASSVEPGMEEDADLGLVFRKRPDEVDDLKEISGVANVLEGRLNEFGIYRFKQIALWEERHELEFSERLSFKDRIQRDEWRRQAADLHQEKYGERLDP